VAVVLAYQISVSESIAVTEAIVANVTVGLAVVETVTVTESVAVLLNGYIVATETVTVSESVSVVVGAASDLLVSVADLITVGESVSLHLPQLFLGVSDTITISEIIIATVVGSVLLDILLSDRSITSLSLSDGPVTRLILSDSARYTVTLTDQSRS
jgi:hypothetical protein